MAQYQSLIDAVSAIITANGNNEITGPIFRDLINNNIIPILGANEYQGIALPSTSPGTPENDVWYIALEDGTYANFGGIIVNKGITILKFTFGVGWSKQELYVDFDNRESDNINVITFKNVFGSWVKSPSNPWTSSIDFSLTGAVNGGIASVYYKAATLEINDPNGIIIIQSDSGFIADELCIVWLIHDKGSGAVQVNVQAGFTGNTLEIPNTPTIESIEPSGIPNTPIIESIT